MVFSSLLLFSNCTDVGLHVELTPLLLLLLLLFLRFAS
jgi:hypothetical protein